MPRRRQSASLDTLEENEGTRSDGGGQYRRDSPVLADLQEPRRRLPLRGVQHRRREQSGVGPGVRELYVMSSRLTIDPSSLSESCCKVAAVEGRNLWGEFSWPLSDSRRLFHGSQLPLCISHRSELCREFSFQGTRDFHVPKSRDCGTRDVHDFHGEREKLVAPIAILRT